MSRTDQHRPYWVQSAERGTSEDHRHHLFGKPYTVNRKRRDERGKVLFEDLSVPVTISRALGMFAPFGADPDTEARHNRVVKEAKRLRGSGAALTDEIPGPVTRRQPIVDTVAIGRYADYCTIDEVGDRDARLEGTTATYLPCSRHLNHVEGAGAVSRWATERVWGLNRPARDITRTSAHTTIRLLTRLADAGEDLEDALDGFVH